MGPTASGKTDLAVELVQRLPCEIISVDSAMVYRGMDIGTAKPGSEILAAAPHRLIDMVDPAVAYSAGRFREDALREMEEIGGHGRIPLLVGGTMLYFRALQQGMAELPSADAAIRARLEAELAEAGSTALHRRLLEVDPVAAGRIHPNDPQRILRALEVYEITGIPLTELFRRARSEPPPYRFIKLVVAPGDRAVLHERIALRFRLMLEQGFVGEVERLRARGDLHPDLPSMRAVGYRQVWEYLDGRRGFEEMVEAGIAATRQLAKRQFTWLRGERQAAWYESTRPDLLERVLQQLEAELHGWQYPTEKP